MSEDAKILEDIGEYKYGFHDRDDNYVFKSERGLSRAVVENISRMKKEPQWMLDFRLKALEHYQSRPMPKWGPSLDEINFEEIYYYVKPTEKSEKSWDDVPDDIKNTFDKLGIPEAERKFLAALAHNMNPRWCITPSWNTSKNRASSFFPLKTVSNNIPTCSKNILERSFRSKTISLPR